MKKYLYFALAACMMVACGKDGVSDMVNDAPVKSVHFELEGDFGSPTFTRSLMADGSEMSDVWVFDFVDDACVQTIHQTKDDDDFGEPTLTMSNGEHNVCFVVSRGDGAVVDEESSTITWERVSDTFWGEKNVTVSQGSAASVAVTLARVATKMKLTVTDEVPVGVATMSARPATWYYGLNYWLGEPASARANVERTVNVPASYVGTSGQLVMSIFGISGTTEWSTNVVVTAKDGEGVVMGTVTIAAAPFKANRQTQYTGRLFSKDGGFTLTLNNEWATAYSGEW